MRRVLCIVFIFKGGGIYKFGLKFILQWLICMVKAALAHVVLQEFSFRNCGVFNHRELNLVNFDGINLWNGIISLFFFSEASKGTVSPLQKDCLRCTDLKRNYNFEAALKITKTIQTNTKALILAFGSTLHVWSPWDAESPFCVNGTYFACISPFMGKTGYKSN